MDEVLGAWRDVDYADLSRLNYCDNVIKETLRMYPPVAVTFREVNRDGFTLEGYHIPKGTNLMVRNTVLFRNTEYLTEMTLTLWELVDFLKAA